MADGGEPSTVPTCQHRQSKRKDANTMTEYGNAVPVEYVEPTSSYAWVIDRDHLADDDGMPGSYADNAATVTGPHNASAALLADLAAGQGFRFKLYDDDGELYYSGRIVFEGPRDFTPDLACDEDAFGPLRDFGTPNAGAVDIRYRRADLVTPFYTDQKTAYVSL